MLFELQVNKINQIALTMVYKQLDKLETSTGNLPALIDLSACIKIIFHVIICLVLTLLLKLLLLPYSYACSNNLFALYVKGSFQSYSSPLKNATGCIGH